MSASAIVLLEASFARKRISLFADPILPIVNSYRFSALPSSLSTHTQGFAQVWVPVFDAGAGELRKKREVCL
jgi:hypothetical protein